MSDVEFKKHRVFRETEDVIFYDISVEASNASDFTETANTSGLTSWGRAVSHINGSWQNVAYSWLDPMTENSVTEKTYAVSYRATAGSIQVGFGTGQYSTMVLMEIAT